MQDRVSASPGRVLITPESGDSYYATITRADNPSVEGTPINKNTLLKDATASLYGLSNTAVPDDVFSNIKSLINSLNSSVSQKARIQSGSYVGTGTGGSENPTGITFSGQAKFVAIGKNGTNNAKFMYLIRDIPYAIQMTSSSSQSGSIMADIGVSWSGNRVEWYNIKGAGYGQFNDGGTTYKYIGIY